MKSNDPYKINLNHHIPAHPDVCNHPGIMAGKPKRIASHCQLIEAPGLGRHAPGGMWQGEASQNKNL